MVEFEVLKAERKTFGTNNFIEVARKVAVTEDGRNEFVSVSRGWTADDGSDRWRQSLTVPDEDDVKKFIAEELLKV